MRKLMLLLPLFLFVGLSVNQSLACYTPSWTATSNITSTSATFTWAAEPNAQNYSVQYRVAPNGTWYFIPGNPVYNTTTTLTGLNPSTNYEWRVRTNCWGGAYSEWTNPIPFTTLPFSCEPPGWLDAVYVTENWASLQWSAVSGAVSYSVEWRVAGGTWANMPGSPYTYTWVELGGLQSCTTYEWRVRTNCTGGMTSAWSYISSFTTLCSGCGTPTWPSTLNVTATSATVHWDVVPGAVSYSVQIRLPGGSWSFVAGSPFNNNTVTINGLNPNTTYEWRVRANCYGGQYSNWTYPIAFTTYGASCEAPTWLGTGNITQTSATFDWDPVPGAVSYSIQWRYAGGTWYNLPGGPFYNTWVNVTGLQPGTAYEWRVRSNCSSWNQSVWSYPASFTTLGNYYCTAPSWTSTTNISSNAATFSWSSVSGAQGYTVQYRLLNGTWLNVPGSPLNYTSITVYGLSPNTTYEWRVKTNCSNWQYSEWTYPIQFTTLGAECYAPQWLYTNNITSSSATFHWDEVWGAVSYSVQWRVAGGTWYNLPGGPFNNNWVNVGGLQAGTTYEWRVQTYCGYGNYSYWSNSVSFTTLSNIGCNVPTWPTTQSVTSTTATVHWDVVYGAVSYQVQYRLPYGSWYDAPGSPFNSTTAIITGLSPNTTYEWRVRACCGYNNYSAWTYPVTFTTTGGYNCNTPTWPATVSVTSTTATVNWDIVYGAQSYSVQYRLPNGTWYNAPGSPFNSTTAVITGLSPGTTYEWRVRANCGYNQYSGWTTPITFTTLGGSSCDPTSWLNTSNITSNSAVLEWAPVPGAVNYAVEYRVVGGTWYPVPGSPFTATWVNLNGLSPSTNYEWHVKTYCATYWSGWSMSDFFTTLSSGGGGGSNDNCADAAQLSVGSTCQYTSGSNINASPSSPPPMGPCYTAGYKDVWFKFTMPGGSNPEVTIRTTAGSLTDAVMEVYSGSSCGSLSYIICEDDNNNGNGSTMPVINLQGYSGQTIWVRVWGYNGSSGTFNICVFNYWSANYTGTDDSEENSIPDQIDPGSSDAHKWVDLVDAPSVLHVSPNPASDFLQVTFLQTEKMLVSNLVMSDMSGQRVLIKDYEPSGVMEFSDQVDVSGLVPGVYILQLVTAQGIQSEKVVITR